MTRISPCLWFDGNGMEAAELYVSVIPGSRITDVSHYGADQPGEEGAVMTVAFELAGQPYTALNGGPEYKFTEAISLQLYAADQEEVDRFTGQLTAGRRRGRPVRLDQGPLRGVLADHPRGDDGADRPTRTRCAPTPRSRRCSR